MKKGFKVCIIGDGGVGKTSLTHRYLHRMFKEDMKMTIGVDFGIKDLQIQNEEVVLHLWDFGGEERFRVLLPSYANGASGAIFIYDTTRYVSLQNANNWLKLFRKNTKESIPIIMVGSKIDLEEDRTVNREEALAKHEELNCLDYIECSAKSGENVEEVFEKIALEILKHKKK